MRYKISIVFLLLFGCVALPDYPRLGLADIAPGIAWPEPAKKNLPLALLEVPLIPQSFNWLAAYDRNQDQLLDPGEMSLAWLDIAVPGHLAPSSGFRLSLTDEKKIRARLEITDPERLSAVEKLLRAAREAGMARGHLLLLPVGQ
jgi:hypothetical protein